jgi:UDPglucose 6-dehydrogenase
MKITVIGTGYVGLVTGTCLAETGNDVLCIDIDELKISLMKEGEVPIYEPHLDALFKRNLKAKRLHFSTSLEKGLIHGDIIFLALPTPEDENGSADLTSVLDVASQIGKKINTYKIIVDKSTVPVGTAEKVRKTIALNSQVEFDVVSNPEFLREGFAVDDFLKPERIIIGSSSKRAINIMQKLYKPFVRSGNPIMVMDERSSELTKYASNAFLATKITFMNEIANFCEKVGADVDMVRQGMGADSRIGKRFLFPGIGFGGACFPKDVKALHKSGRDEGYNFEILDSVLKINELQKPETDDIREAPSIYIIRELIRKGAKVIAFDPEATKNVRKKLGCEISYSSEMYDVLEEADALVICTEWSIFRTPDFQNGVSLEHLILH